jgi:hypothetical protein
LKRKLRKKPASEALLHVYFMLVSFSAFNKLHSGIFQMMEFFILSPLNSERETKLQAHMPMK